MVVFIHSLGSLWQEKNLPAGGTRIWNTTGIRAGSRIRSYAVVFWADQTRRAGAS